MTQHQLVIEYIKEHGSILPAKCGGLIYKDEMMGSETPKRCRELRYDPIKNPNGILESRRDGRFERFYLKGHAPITDESPFMKEWREKWMQPTKELSALF